MTTLVNEAQVQGVAASNGIAIGPAYCYLSPTLTIPDRERQTVDQEMFRFFAATEQAQGELKILYEQVSKRIGEKEAAIFEAHQMVLVDPVLTKGVRRVVEGGQIIEQAVVTAIEEVANIIAAMSNELFASRAADVRDVGRRVLRILLGVEDTSLSNIRKPSIIVANDLSPSDTANLDPNLTLGFCTALGGLTSHSAILARTMGIPAIVALGDQLLKSATMDTILILDGNEGVMVLHPYDETTKRYQGIKQDREKRLNKIKAVAAEPACTGNGRKIEVAANIGDLESARDAINNGAEGVANEWLPESTRISFLPHPTTDLARCSRALYSRPGRRCDFCKRSPVRDPKNRVFIQSGCQPGRTRNDAPGNKELYRCIL